MRTLSQLKEDKYVMVDKDWFLEKEYIKKYSHYALLIYCYILRGITVRKELYFSVENIMDYIGVNHNNKKAKNNIIQILNSFKEDKMLEFDNIQPHKLMVAKNLKELDSFILLYDFEFETILNCSFSLSVDRLLSVFLYIKGCINSETNLAYPMIETIREKTNINSDASIVKYITALRDLDLILYESAGLRRFKDGSMKYAENTYVMNYKGNEIILNDYIISKQLEISKEMSKKQKQLEANAKRSEAMKKYHFNKKIL